MKKVLVAFLLASSLIVACSKGNNDLQNFDKTKLVSEVKKAEFQPKLPTQMPFQVKSTDVSSLGTQKNVMTIMFVGEGGEQMGLQIVKGNVEYADDLKRETIKIGSKEGYYVKNDAGAQMLNWKDNGISYDLTYFSKQSKKEISKEQLIGVAESFK
ncbi:DUF4367 domain-containing protein [Ectobacillus sp. JY-23]|uniref:DUF4367 domain-containing protein n=1 Tax=Ectobacillus sp. JY-23 TaxID=2933872 RepID=UPI001FF37C24|nr:DUF4367 domain-containing protein [Ectobacillus sp. JY-23]UOY92411.1 DUF4367 domain-containing protein [Ectobacillus sp. JY-23]